MTVLPSQQGTEPREPRTLDQPPRQAGTLRADERSDTEARIGQTPSGQAFLDRVRQL